MTPEFEVKEVVKWASIIVTTLSLPVFTIGIGLLGTLVISN